ncbi:MAG: hypothetical protein P4L51_14505 [Puia sp.]|nr:hypothetical protein [Puia sp.]
MGRIDWSRDWFPENRRAFIEGAPQRSLINDIVRDMTRLQESNAEGREVFQQLALKFLIHTVNGKALEGMVNLEQLRSGYEKKLILQPDDLSVTALQAYNLLDGRPIMKKMGVPESQDWEWFAVNPAKRNPDGSSVIERVSDMQDLMLVLELTRMGGKIPSYEDLAAIRNGSKVLIHLEVDGVKADRIVYADPQHMRLVIDRAESEHYGLYQVTDEELYGSRRQKAQLFLPALQAQATAIGVNKPNVARLAEEIIVRDRSFDLIQEGIYDNDRVVYLVEVGKNPDDDFSIHQIRADLRKGPHFSDPVINTVDVPMLEKMMQAADWNQDFTGAGSVQFHNRHPGGNKEMLDVVSQVQADLQYLYAGPNLEGADIAATLALKYLKDSPNEQLVPSTVRAMNQKQVIITFPGKPEFSLESLYHLMNNRFAMGKRFAEGRERETREWYKLDREKTLMGINPPITLVPGEFSVADSLARHASVVELKMPTLLDRTVKGLESGGLMAIHLDRKQFAVPMFIYADPVNKELMVDLAATLAKGNFLEQAMAFKGETMTLDRLINLVGEAPAAKQGHKKWLGGSKNESSDDPDENNLGKSRKK